MYNISDEVEKRKSELNRIIEETEKNLKRVPEGRLRIGGRKYYQVTKITGPNGKYIPVGNTRLIRALAQKDYDLQVFSLAQKELAHLQSGCFYYGRRFEEIYDSLHEKRKELVIPAVLTDDMYIKNWLAQPYEKMGFNDNAPGYFTEGRVHVRSKSELIIANRFEKYHVPFLYEVPVYINGKTFRPDFLVLKMPERKEFYWEHLGMLDSEEYCSKNVWKAGFYSEGGIISGYNLILTLETGRAPLDTDNIDRIIRQVLLP